MSINSLKISPDKDFEKCLEYIFISEGGYSNIKEDLGGKTNYGITQATYNNYNKKHKLNTKDVKYITKEEAKNIYYNDYWLLSGADKIKDKKLALMHFDASVNHGIGMSKKFLEKSKGNFEEYYKLRKQYYDHRIIERPDQKIFYKGWINRIERIKKASV